MGRMYSTTHECTLKVAFDFLLCSQIIILEIVPHCDLKKDKEDLINFVIAFIVLHIFARYRKYLYAGRKNLERLGKNCQ